MDVRERPGFGNQGPCVGSMPARRPASGDHSVMEPPGPIPNPEVKRYCADGSWAKGPARVGRCQLFARLLRKKEPGVFLPLVLERKGATVSKVEPSKKVNR